MNIQKRIHALRSAMAQKGIDIYIIPTADFHHSEYVGDYFKFREYITGSPHTDSCHFLLQFPTPLKVPHSP